MEAVFQRAGGRCEPVRQILSVSLPSCKPNDAKHPVGEAGPAVTGNVLMDTNGWLSELF